LRRSNIMKIIKLIILKYLILINDYEIKVSERIH
jgi:hypothetical protein